MKKLFSILLLLVATLVAGQTTPNLNLNIPTPGTAFGTWGTLLNNNFSNIDNFLSQGGNGLIKRTSPSTWGIGTSTDVIGLFSGTCSPASFLRADGQCAIPPGGGGLTAAEPLIANGASSWYTSKAWISADNPAFVGGDDCSTILNAATTAAALGQDLDVRGLTGDLGCAVDPIPNSYNGKVILGPQRVWLRSNAATLTLPSRIDILGIGVGRFAGGPSSGTVIILCNESDPNAQHNAACAGATFNPTAGGLCKDGSGTTVPCPAICWSKSGEHCLPTLKSFDTKVVGVDIDCNGVAGCVGIQNGMYPQSGSCSGKCGAQENSGIYFSRIDNWGNGGIAANWLVGSQNSDISHMNILNEGETIANCSTARALHIFTPDVVSANGPKRVEIITNTNGSCTTKPVDAIHLDTVETGLEHIHCENISGACVNVGSEANAYGFYLLDVNGAANTGDVVKFSSGHTLGGTAVSISNITGGSGNTINDVYHGTTVGAVCDPLVGFYSFGENAAINPKTTSPCVPQLDYSGGWTSNVALNPWDCVKIVTGSSNVVTQCLTTETSGTFGFALNSTTTNTDPLAVAWSGTVLPGQGPIVNTGSCTARDYVYPDGAANGKVQCSTTPPGASHSTLGVAVASASNGTHVQIQIQPRNPFIYVDQCLGAGSNANPSIVSCGGHTSGSFYCHQTASGGTCQINTTAVTANSVILITPSSAEAGILPGGITCETTWSAAMTAPWEVSRNAGVSFTLKMPSLVTAGAKACFQYQIINF